MNNQENKLTNWIPFPRKISSDFRNGVITLSEMQVYNWLRLNANPYGITTTSLSDISIDLFKGRKSENSINKILLALKRKKCLYYKRRTGSRGSFEVRFGEFILPTGQINTLDRFFEEEDRTSDLQSGISEAEQEQSFGCECQNFNDLKSKIKSVALSLSVNTDGRAPNIDNDKENYISTSIKAKTKLSDFEPRNLDEQLCLNIASSLKERNINFMLSAFNNYGRDTLEKVWRVFKEHELKTVIKNRGAYFNSLIKRIANNENI
ncbi:MAG: hypothetical protein IPG12_11095 [Saprospiraceae bacterium]|nr:hypothetical protein [Saprospiraceae bacterium]